ncbi:MAG: YigZ family protein [Oscillospiraceae bacterium]|nr:YigZ family protein [Oscillospiraceae bacterium]
MDYKTVYETASDAFTEKKSDFIGTIAPVKSEEEAVAFIERIKSGNRKARHNVYAYVLREGNISRYSDDGEPQGTGGVPVLEVIKGRGLSDVCIVVTRYFGGILLGTGGLSRAYSRAACIACDAARVMEMCECTLISFECDYSMYGLLTGLLSQSCLKVKSCDFEDRVRIRLMCKNAFADSLADDITEISNGTVKVIKGGCGWEDLSS